MFVKGRITFICKNRLCKLVQSVTVKGDDNAIQCRNCGWKMLISMRLLVRAAADRETYDCSQLTR